MLSKETGFFSDENLLQLLELLGLRVRWHFVSVSLDASSMHSQNMQSSVTAGLRSADPTFTCKQSTLPT